MQYDYQHEIVVTVGGSEAIDIAMRAIDVYKRQTTTIAAALAEKETGAVLATAGCGNSQRIFGQDVLSRIKASVAGTGEKLKRCV